MDSREGYNISSHKSRKGMGSGDMGLYYYGKCDKCKETGGCRLIKKKWLCRACRGLKDW